MKVRKENRVLTVDEADKAFYLSEGYDVVEAKNGEYVISGKGNWWPVLPLLNILSSSLKLIH